jgi:2'-5' RNA ligase
MKRLFFALWPNDAERKKLDAFNQSLEVTGRKLRADNLHVTLVFLGNVSDDICSTLLTKARSIEASPVQLVFNELNYWKRPRVICLTCQQQTLPVYTLVNQISRLVSDLGISIEQRPYRAHVTLVRKAVTRPDVHFAPFHLHFERFALVESQSTENGVHYEVLKDWPLAAKH